jgi:mevalonate kinase
MLIGEHAVLYGQDAIVIAVNSRLTVKIESATEEYITITSDKYGTYKIHEQLPSSLDLVLCIINHIKIPHNLPLKISISSEFSDQIGFGSSASLIVGLVTSWLLFSGQIKDLGKSSLAYIFEQGKGIAQFFQGVASGADIAASTFGGMLLYNMQGYVRNIVAALPLVSVYSGLKKKTAEVIRLVHDRQKSKPKFYEELFNEAGFYTKRAVLAIQSEDFRTLGKVMEQYHLLMEQFGVNNVPLQDICDRLTNVPQIFGSKISGSGLGDSVIALGIVPEELRYILYPYVIHDIEVTDIGVRVEKLNESI